MFNSLINKIEQIKFNIAKKNANPYVTSCEHFKECSKSADRTCIGCNTWLDKNHIKRSHLKTLEVVEEKIMITQNKKIEKIGLTYTGHFNILSFEILFDNWRKEVSKDKMKEIVSMLYNGDDTIYVEELDGKLIRLVYDDKDLEKPIGIMDILSDNKVVYFD